MPFIIWRRFKDGSPSIVEQYDLKMPQWGVLSLICLLTYCVDYPDGKAVSINQIAALGNCSRNTVKRNIRQLVRLGLVKAEGGETAGEAYFIAAILPGYWPMPSQ